MIITELYNGQGIGNQLWCYAVTRAIAKQNNFKFGIMNPHKFKGKEFLEIDFGEEIIGGEGPEGGPPIKLPLGILNYYKEKEKNHPIGVSITKIDQKLLSIQDNTKIDGTMQSIDYIDNMSSEVKSWFKVKPDKNITEFSSKDICIIHIRGGDYHGTTAVLTPEYYKKSVDNMKEKNKNMIFYIITDDVQYAKYIFPNYKIIGSALAGINDINKANHHNGGPIWMDWTILKNCKNAIISSSSFSWWPVWLNSDVNVIAPMYWLEHKRSDGFWSCGDSLIKGWNYLHRNGSIYSYDECALLKQVYESQNLHLWR